MLLLFVSTLIFACKAKQEPVVDNATGTTYYGEKFDPAGAISHAQLLRQVVSSDTVKTKVTGLVDGVCQAKGCWMSVVDKSNPDGESFFVKFKDYGFFMPLDFAGSEVTMNGKAYQEITTVEELKHYAEDEGQSAEEIAAITEPLMELKFLADGVIVQQ